MANTHPAAPQHLPGFLPGPDGSDPLFTVVVVFVLVILLVAGVFYFRLHALPERVAEKRNSIQLQLITVLALLALFTHNNAFWVLALLTAVIRIPDFSTPIYSIAASLKKLAGEDKTNAPAASAPEKAPGPAEAAAPAAAPAARASAWKQDQVAGD